MPITKSGSKRLLIIGAHAFVAAIMVTESAFATIIVGIRTPDGVVMAADSKGTFRDSGPAESRPVCKLFTLRSVGFAISGMVKDPGREFNAELLVARAISRQPSFIDAADDIQVSVRDQLTRQLNQLQQDVPDLLAKLISNEDGYVTSILLAGYQQGIPTLIGLGFRATKDREGNVVLTPSRLSCPGDCTSGVYSFYLGNRGPIDEYTREHGEHLNMPPESAAQFLAELVIDSGVSGVGPPVDVLVISKAGLSWRVRKNSCGGTPTGFQEVPYSESE